LTNGFDVAWCFFLAVSGLLIVRRWPAARRTLLLSTAAWALGTAMYVRGGAAMGGDLGKQGPWGPGGAGEVAISCFLSFASFWRFPMSSAWCSFAVAERHRGVVNLVGHLERFPLVAAARIVLAAGNWRMRSLAGGSKTSQVGAQGDPAAV
jgi:hypothetical protein